MASDQRGGPAPDGAAGEGLLSLPAEPGDVERMVEALLFASAEPLSERDLEETLPSGSDAGAALDSLARHYRGRGVELRRIGRGWAFRTAPQYSRLFERKVTQRRKLSRAATETLAIVAYHQPVTRSEVEAIRGVAVSRGTIHTLMEQGWVGLGRRKTSPGRPVTYVVTQAFLDHFGLESTRDLPGLKELKALGLLQRPWSGDSVPAGRERGEPPSEEAGTKEVSPDAGSK